MFSLKHRRLETVKFRWKCHQRIRENNFSEEKTTPLVQVSFSAWIRGPTMVCQSHCHCMSCFCTAGPHLKKQPIIIISCFISSSIKIRGRLTGDREMLSMGRGYDRWQWDSNQEYSFLDCSLLNFCLGVVVQKDLWKSSGPNPLLSQSHLKPVTQAYIQTALNISRHGESMTSLGNLCQSLVTLPVKKCFLMFRGNLLHFTLCPLPLTLSSGATEKSLAPSSVHSFFL